MKYFNILLLLIANIAFAQNTQVLPDSVITKKLIADTVVSKQGRFNNIMANNKVIGKDLEASIKMVAPLGEIGSIIGSTADYNNINNTTLNTQTINATTLNLSGNLSGNTGAFNSLSVGNISFSDISATNAYIADTVFADVVKANVIDAVNMTNAQTIETENLQLNQMLGHTNVPVFADNNQNLTHSATGFTITIPAADFQPEKITPIDQVASPFLGQIALFDNGDVQGYGALYGLIAPLYLSLHNKENIRIKELEFCVLDRHADMDMWVSLYETGLNSPMPTKSTILKMKAKSNGATASPNYGCFKANLTTDDFDIDYAQKSYWVRAIPRHNSVNNPEDAYNGEFPEAWPTVTSNAQGSLKLLHVRVYYDFK